MKVIPTSEAFLKVLSVTKRKATINAVLNIAQCAYLAFHLLRSMTLRIVENLNRAIKTGKGK